MVAVKIPGADSIDVPAPSRDPGVTATPQDFGSDIGAGLQHLGDAAVSVGAHLYQKTQAASDQVYADTYNVSMAPATQQTIQRVKAQYPNGGPEFTQALNDELLTTHDQVIQGLANKGITPSDGAMAAVKHSFNGVRANALVAGVTYAHNQQITGLQTQQDDNVDVVKSQVLSGNMSLDDGLKTVDGTVKGSKALFSGTELTDRKDKWQQGVIDAAIENRTKSGDLAGAAAIKDKYYGKTPKWGDSNAAGVANVAQNLGISPRDLAAVISYETGGKFDPTMMGGKNNNYQGLIQFGPEERAKYGVKPGQSFQEQLPAVQAFLYDRGVRPGMGLAQIYSVVNAGSLDKNGQPRWAASDGNGNIASHVQKIQLEHYGAADKFLSGAAVAGSKGVKVASADRAIGGVGQPNADASGDTTDASSGDNAPVLPNVAKSLYWDKQFHAAGVDQKQADAAREAQLKRESDNRELDVMKDIHSDNPTIPAREIWNDPKLTLAAKEKLFNVKTSLTGGEKADKTYGPGFYDAYQKVHAAEGDPNKITDPTSLYSRVGKNGDLTVAGVDKLVSEISGTKTPEGVAEAEMKKQFLTTAKGQISGSDEGLHIKDPKGDQLYLKFLAQAWPAYDAGRKAGKSASELLNPDSPSYIGKSIESFKRPMDQWFADTIGGSAVHGGTTAAPAAFDVKNVKSLDDLTAAYQAGRVPREVAAQIAIEKGWAVRKAPVTPASIPVSQ